MKTSSVSQGFIQIYWATSNNYEKFKNNLSKKLNKQLTISSPIKEVLKEAWELIIISVIISSILGIYFASGLHEWWLQLVSQFITS